MHTGNHKGLLLLTTSKGYYMLKVTVIFGLNGLKLSLGFGHVCQDVTLMLRIWGSGCFHSWRWGFGFGSPCPCHGTPNPKP